MLPLAAWPAVRSRIGSPGMPMPSPIMTWASVAGPDMPSNVPVIFNVLPDSVATTAPSPVKTVFDVWVMGVGPSAVSYALVAGAAAATGAKKPNAAAANRYLIANLSPRDIPAPQGLDQEARKSSGF